MSSIRRGPPLLRLILLGPAFVAAIAYVDPGNFATNISAGAKFGYLLLWVILAANAMGMIVQYLSAKVGLVTGMNLPELCRDRYPTPARWFLWVQAEIVAIATDLAEFVGAAIALHLLFGLPPFVGGLITAVAAFVILALHSRGYRPFEVTIGLFLMVVLAGFAFNLALVGIDLPGAAAGLVPAFRGTDSVLVAVAILGATVMPHVVYLHSALTQRRIVGRTDDDQRYVLGFLRVDVLVAMLLAGAVNASMLLVAAGAFHVGGSTEVSTIEGAHAAFGTTLGPLAAFAFAVALLASGISSSSVGTLAGQVVMQGFINRRIPLLLRRLITMAPALVVLGLGVDATMALVVSQAVLSFGIPFALIPLVHFTSRRSVMGPFVNARPLTAVAILITVLVVALNAYLIVALVA